MKTGPGVEPPPTPGSKLTPVGVETTTYAVPFQVVPLKYVGTQAVICEDETTARTGALGEALAGRVVLTKLTVAGPVKLDPLMVKLCPDAQLEFATALLTLVAKGATAPKTHESIFMPAPHDNSIGAVVVVVEVVEVDTGRQFDEVPDCG